jgi:hypothetical protein
MSRRGLRPRAPRPIVSGSIVTVLQHAVRVATPSV